MLRPLARTLMLPAALSLAACGAPLDVEVGEASPADLDAKEDAAHRNLSVTDQKAVLRELDNICGDTWCAGDWRFDFKKLSCKLDLGTCTWTALIQPSVPVASPVPVYWRSCKVSGVHALRDLVTTVNGYSSLNQDYYAASTECVQKIEPKLPAYTPLPE